MKTGWIGGMVLVAAVSAILGSFASRGTAAREEEKGATSGPRYTVVETEGHNLLVTDNRTETLYFYTIDKDAKIGSDLKLRGKIDLKQVGKDVITPAKAAVKE